MDARFEIQSVVPENNRSRIANHVIAYFDRILTYEMIKKDNPSVSMFLNCTNIAQVTDYIQRAQQANAVNALAVLLEYKNVHFADFDPMADYTLEW